MEAMEPGGTAAGAAHDTAAGAAHDTDDRWPDDEIGALLRAGDAAPRLGRLPGWWAESGDRSVVLRTGLAAHRAGRPAALRSARVSAGAALAGMRLVVAGHGHRPHVTLMPDPTRPGVLAELRRGAPAEPSPVQRELHALLDAGEGDVRDVDVADAAVLYALRRAAGAEGAWSRSTTDPAEVAGPRLRDRMRPPDGSLYVTLGAEGEPATADLRIGLALQQMLLTAAVLGRRARVTAMSFDGPGSRRPTAPPRLLVTVGGGCAVAGRAGPHGPPSGPADSRPA